MDDLNLEDHHSILPHKTGIKNCPTLCKKQRLGKKQNHVIPTMGNHNSLVRHHKEREVDRLPDKNPKKDIKNKKI